MEWQKTLRRIDRGFPRGQEECFQYLLRCFFFLMRTHTNPQVLPPERQLQLRSSKMNLL